MPAAAAWVEADGAERIAAAEFAAVELAKGADPLDVPDEAELLAPSSRGVLSALSS